MWLSEMAGRSGLESENPIQTGRVTIGGAAPAVFTDGETRSIRVLAPGGFIWKPAAGQNILALKADDGAFYLAGAEVPAADSLRNGELCLFSQDHAAEIILDNNGTIRMKGNLNIQVVVNIIGSIYLNGVSLRPGSTA